eukprot:TRINITY_DN27_c0_g2_i1.p2 TRINITY_DN27_c0_g2~~TRINITY_DN27_c0_g2_i1.p2  ORF type:complete len:487 (+),score=222.00 TRINITY_DN27_c0_g2_i1:53-1462(+)
MRRVAAVAGLVACAMAAPAADLVEQLPGFEKAPFKVYSGYLTVQGPIAGYDKLDIHYEFHEAQTNAAKAPVATWHQGGPGGSSLYGAFTEMGYFQTNGSATYVNDFAWNKVANMLYLESPAGSGENAGFSICYEGSQPARTCRWNDTNQGEAYAKTLEEFFRVFPEYANNDLYLTGESYAGQYLPNIANYILTNGILSNLKGIAVGNGCWGGSANSVVCNGYNEDQNNVEMFYGKDLISKKMYNEIYAACKFPDTSAKECETLLDGMDKAVGSYNIYNIYDNCPQNDAWLERAGKTKRWLKQHLTSYLHRPAEGQRLLNALEGGYDWSCGGGAAQEKYFLRTDVQQALHLTKGPGVCKFDYDLSGPASVTVYPQLIGKIRILIYNGDADACVPYKGNEEWTTAMAKSGIVEETKAWHPWYASEGVPAGYLTQYTKDFSFLTIRLAGHMVPTFQPDASLTFFTRFLEGTY